MRVLHIGSGKLYGGIETLLVTLARLQGRNSAIESSFALCFEGRLSQELTAAGAPVYHLGEVRASRPWTIRAARVALRSLLKHNSFDAVICHAPWPQAMFAPVVRERGIKLVFWMHDATDGRHWLEVWSRRTKPELVLYNSAFTARTLRGQFAKVRSCVISYPVAEPAASEKSTRDEVREELGTAPNKVVVIQTSRLQAWKGQHLHLEALSLLRDVDGWECWQVGGAQRQSETEYLEQLQQAANRYGLTGRVRFLGQRQDVARLLAAADIHCQPNAGPEPFGIAFIEALYAGLPVVTTAMGAAVEIIDPSCGMLVPPNDVQALSKALRKLIESAALRQSLATGGPLRARQICEPERQVLRLREALLQSRFPCQPALP